MNIYFFICYIYYLKIEVTYEYDVKDEEIFENEKIDQIPF